MVIERIYPDGLRRPPTYVPVVRATGGSTIYLSGQVPVDSNGDLVGEGDFGAQARQVFANLRVALARVGADFSHVVRMTTYVVGYTPELRDALGAARSEAMGDARAASTLLGVQALAAPGYLIEVEAIAVID
jgi:enamine deaminase RidA (YjgF/YER057c/UK114 family)